MCNKKFKLSNLLNLWVTVIFWSVVVSCVFFVIKPETRSVGEMVSMFLPVFMLIRYITNKFPALCSKRLMA